MVSRYHADEIPNLGLGAQGRELEGGRPPGRTPRRRRRDRPAGARARSRQANGRRSVLVHGGPERGPPRWRGGRLCRRCGDRPAGGLVRRRRHTGGRVMGPRPHGGVRLRFTVQLPLTYFCDGMVLTLTTRNPGSELREHVTSDRPELDPATDVTTVRSGDTGRWSGIPFGRSRGHRSPSYHPPRGEW